MKHIFTCFYFTYPKVGCCKSIAGGHICTGGGVGVVGVDVGQKSGHVGGHSGAQVLGRQTVEVAEIFLDI